MSRSYLCGFSTLILAVDPGDFYGEEHSLAEQDATEEKPQRAVLLRRAYDLLAASGKPLAEQQLIQHIFGAADSSSNQRFWTVLLHEILQSSRLFLEDNALSEADGSYWSLASWQQGADELDSLDFVVVDTETTGLRPGVDRVIEVAAVRVHGGNIVDSWQSLVNPRRSLPRFITQFTGITQAMVNTAPPMELVISDFLAFVGDATLVGHNIRFDLSFLQFEAQLAGRVFPQEGLDTIPLARRFLPGLKRFKLDMVAAHCGVQIRGRHRASGDAEVTAEVFVYLLRLAREQGITTLGFLRRRLGLPVAWSGDISQAGGTGKDWLPDERLSEAAVVRHRPNGMLFLDPVWKREFPTQPGVYLMKDVHNQVIYVGKAKNLKERLASYYSQPLGYTPRMDGLLQSVNAIETRVLGSELEALLVESRLIKQFQPAYNVQLRNDVLYPFIKIDVQHSYPRVYATREVTADGARYFGPFRNQRMADLTVELVQKIFPVRTCTRALPPQARPSDPCLRLHLGRCSAPCRGNADPQAYQEVIAQVCAFLGGEREDLLERLRRQMVETAQQLRFERAAWLRDVIHSTEEMLIGQRLITGAVEANNLLIVYPSSDTDCNELFLIRHGRLLLLSRVMHQEETMLQAVHESLEHAARSEASPAIVGKAEVDQINIISRWIHLHSSDRAFFAFQHALSDENHAQILARRVWEEVSYVRDHPASVSIDIDPEHIISAESFDRSHDAE